MTAAFTPGPWERRGCSVTALDWDGEPPRDIAIAYPNIRVSGAESLRVMRANASLIAAAPELYDALEELLTPMLTKDLHTRQQNARAALAKARGEA